MTTEFIFDMKDDVAVYVESNGIDFSRINLAKLGSGPKLSPSVMVRDTTSTTTTNSVII